jgi:hypothetical protein
VVLPNLYTPVIAITTNGSFILCVKRAMAAENPDFPKFKEDNRKYTENNQIEVKFNHQSI